MTTTFPNNLQINCQGDMRTLSPVDEAALRGGPKGESVKLPHKIKEEMMGDTNIEWTEKTWDPTRGCSRVSPGCFNCYAERQAIRQRTTGYKDLVTITNGHPAWTGIVLESPEHILTEPLHWKKPSMIFVDSMSDLFHEDQPDEVIDKVFAVMAQCAQHTFQILTKRADRMQAYMSDEKGHGARRRVQDVLAPTGNRTSAAAEKLFDNWPLANVWLGVSVENQEYAGKRIPKLLDTSAKIRFVSYEPALGPVDFLYPSSIWPKGPTMCCSGQDCGCMGKPIEPPLIYDVSGAKIDWIIVGGESGPGARPFDIAWAEKTLEQCAGAGVACFIKQLGSRPFSVYDGTRADFYPRDTKGGDPEEWAPHLRVRQFPKARLDHAS